MYVPPSMRLTREQAWALVERYGFAVLVGADHAANHDFAPQRP